jgi:hypothetical protein
VCMCVFPVQVIPGDSKVLAKKPEELNTQPTSLGVGVAAGQGAQRTLFQEIPHEDAHDGKGAKHQENDKHLASVDLASRDGKAGTPGSDDTTISTSPILVMSEEIDVRAKESEEPASVGVADPAINGAGGETEPEEQDAQPNSQKVIADVEEIVATDRGVMADDIADGEPMSDSSSSSSSSSSFGSDHTLKGNRADEAVATDPAITGADGNTEPKEHDVHPNSQKILAMDSKIGTACSDDIDDGDSVSGSSSSSSSPGSDHTLAGNDTDEAVDKDKDVEVFKGEGNTEPEEKNEQPYSQAMSAIHGEAVTPSSNDVGRKESSSDSSSSSSSSSSPLPGSSYVTSVSLEDEETLALAMLHHVIIGPKKPIQILLPRRIPINIKMHAAKLLAHHNGSCGHYVVGVVLEQLKTPGVSFQLGSVNGSSDKPVRDILKYQACKIFNSHRALWDEEYWDHGCSTLDEYNLYQSKANTWLGTFDLLLITLAYPTLEFRCLRNMIIRGETVTQIWTIQGTRSIMLELSEPLERTSRPHVVYLIHSPKKFDLLAMTAGKEKIVAERGGADEYKIILTQEEAAECQNQMIALEKDMAKLGLMESNMLTMAEKAMYIKLKEYKAMGHSKRNSLILRMTQEYTDKIAGKIADASERLAARRKATNEAQKKIWFASVHLAAPDLCAQGTAATTKPLQESKVTTAPMLSPTNAMTTTVIATPAVITLDTGAVGGAAVEAGHGDSDLKSNGHFVARQEQEQEQETTMKTTTPAAATLAAPPLIPTPILVAATLRTQILTSNKAVPIMPRITSGTAEGKMNLAKTTPSTGPTMRTPTNEGSVLTSPTAAPTLEGSTTTTSTSTTGISTSPLSTTKPSPPLTASPTPLLLNKPTQFMGDEGAAARPDPDSSESNVVGGADENQSDGIEDPETQVYSQNTSAAADILTSIIKSADEQNLRAGDEHAWPPLPSRVRNTLRVGDHIQFHAVASKNVTMLVPTRRDDNDKVTKQFEGKIVSIVAARGSKRLHGTGDYVQMYRILFAMPPPGKRATCATTDGAWIRRAGAVANGDYEDPPTGNWIILLDDHCDADQDMDPPEGHREGKKMEAEEKVAEETTGDAPNSRSRTKRKSPDEGVPSGDPEDPFWVYEQEEFRWLVKAKKTDCDAMLIDTPQEAPGDADLASATTAATVGKTGDVEPTSPTEAEGVDAAEEASDGGHNPKPKETESANNSGKDIDDGGAAPAAESPRKPGTGTEEGKHEINSSSLKSNDHVVARQEQAQGKEQDHGQDDEQDDEQDEDQEQEHKQMEEVIAQMKINVAQAIVLAGKAKARAEKKNQNNRHKDPAARVPGMRLRGGDVQRQPRSQPTGTMAIVKAAPSQNTLTRHKHSSMFAWVCVMS